MGAEGKRLRPTMLLLMASSLSAYVPSPDFLTVDDRPPNEHPIEVNHFSLLKLYLHPGCLTDHIIGECWKCITYHFVPMVKARDTCMRPLIRHCGSRQLHM